MKQTLSRGKRVGPRMRDVERYVSRHPGTVVYQVALYVAPRGPHGIGNPGIGYGYRTVDRALAAGLVRAEANPARKGSSVLYPVVQEQQS